MANLIACAGVDIEAFQSRCRVPLNPGVWNLWHISRTNLDAAGPKDIDTSYGADDSALWGKYAGVRYVLLWWFQQIAGGSYIWADNFDSVQVWVLPPGKMPPISDLRVIASKYDVERTTCYTPGMSVELDTNPVYDVFIKFVYRGTLKSMPWPSYKAVFDPVTPGKLPPHSSNHWQVWCPEKADYQLLAAYDYLPGKAPKVPERRSGFELPTGLNPTKSITGALFWGSIVIGAAWITASTIERRVLP
jgi:hypothetical protein